MEVLERRQASFEALQEVHSVRSINDLVPDNQPRKREILATFAPLLERVPVLGTPEPIDVERLRKTLGRLDLKLGRDEDDDTWDPARKPEAESIEEARELLKGIRTAIAQDSGQLTERLGLFQSRFLADFDAKLDFLRRSLNPEPVTIDALPTTLREGFIGKSGRYLMQIYARDDIGNRLRGGHSSASYEKSIQT